MYKEVLDMYARHEQGRFSAFHWVLSRDMIMVCHPLVTNGPETVTDGEAEIEMMVKF